jgi:probable HAF family extracellular repeat protein
MNAAPRLAALLAAFAAAGALADTRYTARDIGDLGYAGVIVAGVNAKGQVVGQSERPGGGIDFPHAFATGPGGVGMIDLCPELVEASCAANAIDDDGLVVGWLENAGAFVVQADGSGFAAEPSTLDLNGLSPGGHVVGERAGPGGVQAVVSRGVGQRLHGLGSLTGAKGTSWGNGVNRAGTVVGCSVVSAASQHAFAFIDPASGMRDLGTLGGANSCAMAVNDSGEIAGWADLPAGSTHAVFAKGAAGPLVDIGTLGGSFSQAMAISAHGRIVGFSTLAAHGFASHAFIYDIRTRRLTDLNTLVDGLPPGTVLDVAAAINAAGQIAATSGDGRGWLLTPESAD